MTNQILNPDQSALVVIDVQEKLIPAMSEFDTALANLEILIAGFQACGRPVIVTEQYPRGLGPTIEPLARQVAGPYLEKTAFSCFGCEAFVATAAPYPDLVLAGIESHVCVLQTALAALARHGRVFVAADAVTSRSQANKQLALDQLRSAGAAVASTETLLFQLLGDAGHEAFRTISRLVR